MRACAECARQGGETSSLRGPGIGGAQSRASAPKKMVGQPMFIVKCGAASNLEPVLRMLLSDWSRHHMIFISMPLLKLKSTFTRSDL